MRSTWPLIALALFTLSSGCSSRQPTVQELIRDGDVNRLRATVSTSEQVDRRDKGGYSLLHFAAESGQADVIKYFVELGGTVDAQTSNGFTPLHKAAEVGNLAAATALVECGADVNATTRLGATPLDLATFSGNLNVAEYIESRGGRKGQRSTD